jgi:hypothetical protein
MLCGVETDPPKSSRAVKREKDRISNNATRQTIMRVRSKSTRQRSERSTCQWHAPWDDAYVPATRNTKRSAMDCSPARISRTPKKGDCVAGMREVARTMPPGSWQPTFVVTVEVKLPPNVTPQGAFCHLTVNKRHRRQNMSIEPICIANRHWPMLAAKSRSEPDPAVWSFIGRAG